MAGGRPLKFETVLDLETKIQAYFADCDPHMEEITEWLPARAKDGKKLKDENGLDYLVEVTHKVMTPQKAYTVTGLANYLDTTRRTLLDHEESGEFSHTIKKAKSMIEQYWENNLESNNVAGTIFNLKNNFGWVDRTEVDNNVNVGVQISGRQAEQLLAARRNRTIVEGDSTEG